MHTANGASLEVMKNGKPVWEWINHGWKSGFGGMAKNGGTGEAGQAISARLFEETLPWITTRIVRRVKALATRGAGLFPQTALVSKP